MRFVLSGCLRVPPGASGCLRVPPVGRFSRRAARVICRDPKDPQAVAEYPRRPVGPPVALGRTAAAQPEFGLDDGAAWSRTGL
jgi:hypothetical protein